MNITYILLFVQFLILVALVVVLYFDNKRLEKELDEYNKEH